MCTVDITSIERKPMISNLLRYKGFAVEDYGFTLGALTLHTSGFCNARVLSVMVRFDLSYIIYRVRPETVKWGQSLPRILNKGQM